MGHTKVFVGNLSFKTREADLASEFSSAGKVVSANIITRGPRSLGYGFVELESEEEAQKAVQLMNRKNIDTREINVELAKPRDETKLQKDRPAPRRRGRGPGAAPGSPPGSSPPSAGEGAVPSSGTGDQPRPAGGQRGGFAGRGGRRNFRPRNNQNAEGAPPAGGAGGASGAGNAGASGAPPRRGGRGPRGNFGRPNPAATPSKTTLFVANLPFALEDQGLADLFKDLHITKAHVVKNRNGRSKGFGFVEFDSEDNQNSALTAAENFESDGRKLIVKIALTENRRDENAGAQADSGNTASSQEKKEEKEGQKSE